VKGIANWQDLVDACVHVLGDRFEGLNGGVDVTVTISGCFSITLLKALGPVAGAMAAMTSLSAEFSGSPEMGLLPVQPSGFFVMPCQHERVDMIYSAFCKKCNATLQPRGRL
jgi:hypothetical protein